MLEVLLAMVLVLIMIQWLGRYIYNYKLTPNHLEFYFLGCIVNNRIALSDIELVRLYYLTDPARPLLVMNSSNRFFGKSVLIQKTHGLLRWLIITPDHPDEFIKTFWQLKASLG